MKDVEKLLKEIIKRSKDKDAIYIYGVEYSSTSDPGFKALVRFTKEGVAPAVFAANSKQNLKKMIKKYLDGGNPKDVNILYHRGQISIEESAIRFHELLIEEYENKAAEDVDEGFHSKLRSE